MADITILEMLSAEYLELIRIYESYNDQSLSIKSWSVSVGAASLLAMYYNPIPAFRGRMGALLSALIVVPFYLTDVLWKSFQLGYVPRIQELERFFTSFKTDQLWVHQIYSDWNGPDALFFGGKLPLFMEAMLKFNVAMPHVVVMAIGIVAAIWLRPTPSADNASDEKQGQ